MRVRSKNWDTELPQSWTIVQHGAQYVAEVEADLRLRATAQYGKMRRVDASQQRSSRSSQGHRVSSAAIWGTATGMSAEITRHRVTHGTTEVEAAQISVVQEDSGFHWSGGLGKRNRNAGGRKLSPCGPDLDQVSARSGWFPGLVLVLQKVRPAFENTAALLQSLTSGCKSKRNV